VNFFCYWLTGAVVLSCMYVCDCVMAVFNSFIIVIFITIIILLLPLYRSPCVSWRPVKNREILLEQTKFYFPHAFSDGICRLGREMLKFSLHDSHHLHPIILHYITVIYHSTLCSVLYHYCLEMKISSCQLFVAVI